MTKCPMMLSTLCSKFYLLHSRKSYSGSEATDLDNDTIANVCQRIIVDSRLIINRCKQKDIEQECQRNTTTEVPTRMYRIVVTATDSAGNVGSSSAYVIAWVPGPEYSYSKSGKKSKGGKTPRAIIFSGRRESNKEKSGKDDTSYRTSKKKN